MRIRNAVLWYFHELCAFDATDSQHQAFGWLAIPWILQKEVHYFSLNNAKWYHVGFLGIFPFPAQNRPSEQNLNFHFFSIQQRFHRFLWGRINSKYPESTRLKEVIFLWHTLFPLLKSSILCDQYIQVLSEPHLPSHSS